MRIPFELDYIPIVRHYNQIQFRVSFIIEHHCSRRKLAAKKYSFVKCDYFVSIPSFYRFFSCDTYIILNFSSQIEHTYARKFLIEKKTFSVKHSNLNSNVLY